MSLTSRKVLLALLCIANMKGYASDRVADALELMNAVSEDGQSLVTQGLIGKGVGIAIIDQTINKEHIVFKDAHIVNCGTEEEQRELIGSHGQYTASPIVGIAYPQGQQFESVEPGRDNKVTFIYRGGLAPGAKIYSYPYLTSDGYFSDNNMKIIDTLNQILHHNNKNQDNPIKIINMSFELTSDFNNPKIVSKFKEIAAAGILVIHAADNNKAARTIESDSIRAAENWIEVGALYAFKYNGHYDGWWTMDYNSGSSYPRADSKENFIWAPGHLIPVASGEKYIGLQSGTSFAAPYVAAAAALLWEQNPSLTCEQIKDTLMSCPVHTITMDTIVKSGGVTISDEQHKVQRPVLDIRHILGLTTEEKPSRND